jgi:hypothetical protein
MRVSRSLLILLAVTIAAAAPAPLYAQHDDRQQDDPQQEDAKPDEAKPDDAKPDEAKPADAKETRLSMADIRELHRKRTAAAQIADKVAEQGRSFDVTDDIVRELRGFGLNAAQIAEVKDASTDPLVPGKYLPSTDADRDALMELIKKATAKCGAAISPVSTQHITLWAPKNMQKTYLADIQKAEKFLHTKCAEPLRSGLDKRSAHIIVLNYRTEGAAWWHAALELDPKMFEQKDNPGFSEQIRRDIVKNPTCDAAMITIICVSDVGADWTHRSVAYAVGYQLGAQLTNKSGGVFQTGLGNWTETAVCGSPVRGGGEMVYGQDVNRGVSIPEDWALLVKKRLSARKTTPMAELLKGNPQPSQAVCAERWLLVGLLNQQPVKFGKLLLALKDGESDAAAIEKVYGWNEKELEKQWKAYALKPGKKKAGT